MSPHQALSGAAVALLGLCLTLGTAIPSALRLGRFYVADPSPVVRTALGTMAGALGYLFVAGVRRRPWLGSLAFLGVLIYLGALFYGGTTNEGSESAGRCWGALGCLLVPLLLGVVGREEPVALVFSGSAMLCLVRAGSDSILGGALYSGGAWRLNGTFMGTNDLALASSVMLPLCFSRAVKEGDPFRPYWRAMALGMFVALLLTSSRGALLAGIAGVSAEASVSKAKARALIPHLPWALAAAVFAWGRRYWDAKTSGATARSDHGHADQMRSGWDAFAAHPIAGVGIGGFDHKVQALGPHGPRILYSQSTLSLPLQALAEGGMLGGILLVLIVYNGLRSGYLSSVSTGSGYLGAWVAFVVFTCTGLPLFLPNHTFGTALFAYLLSLSVRSLGDQGSSMDAIRPALTKGR